MLSFYRYAACPFCNLRIHRLSEKYPDWQHRGPEAIAIFHSPAKNILKYAGKQSPPFPIIPDPGKKLYHLYGVEKSLIGMLTGMLRIGEMIQSARKGFFHLYPENGLSTLPADFLIDEKGTIAHAYYGSDMGDHVPFEKVNSWLR